MLRHTDTQGTSRIEILIVRELVGKLLRSFQDHIIYCLWESGEGDRSDAVISMYKWIELPSDIVEICRWREPFLLRSSSIPSGIAGY